MATEVKMPQLGETVVEGTITKWLKNEGDTVAEDDLLVEISTDKVDSEVPSSVAGVLQKILVPEGETVKVGTALALIGDAAEAAGAQPQAEQSQDEQPEAGQSQNEQPEAGQSQAEQPQAGQPQAGQPQGEQPPAGQQDGAPQAQPEAGAPAEEQPAPPSEPEGAVVAPPPPPPPPQSGDGQSATAPAATEPGSETAKSPQASERDATRLGVISPLVRRIADENDVDLAEVKGTGTGGRIRKQDVLRFVEQKKSSPQPAAAMSTMTEQAPAAPEPAPAAPAAPETPAPETPAPETPAPTPPSAPPAPTPTAPSVAPPAAPPAAPAHAIPQPAAAQGEEATEREWLVPWSNIRRLTAEHMVAAHLESARAWNAVEVDWSNVVKLREQAKAAFKEREGFNLTYMPFLARAVCETILEMPEVGATFDEANQANLLRRYVNLGIAVALEGGGLIVPVVKSADEKNLAGVARAINDIATRARTKKLSPDDLVGGTFTITNPGPFGSILSVPIIPKGQTAILAFEAIQKRVVVTENDAMAVRSMGFLPMSWDHRTIDGAEAAKFLARLRERIETTDFTPELAPYL